MANQGESAFVFVTPRIHGKTIFNVYLVRFSNWRVPEYCNCLSQGNESHCIISYSKKRRTKCDTKSGTKSGTKRGTKCGTKRRCPVKNQWEATPNGPPRQLGLKTCSCHFSFGCRPGASAFWNVEGYARADKETLNSHAVLKKRLENRKAPTTRAHSSASRVRKSADALAHSNRRNINRPDDQDHSP